MPQRGLLGFGQEPKGDSKARAAFGAQGEGGKDDGLGWGRKLNVARILAEEAGQMPVSLGWKGKTSRVGVACQCPPDRRQLWGGTGALG